ncbi:MAG: hypothetical protein HOV66_29370 [Streptomycetaceae bacterium]|nr:hypothetical protein [Streptomycetaceae bacterium]
MATRIPVVDHLLLEPEPRLKAVVCAACGADYLARRNACASCGGTEFTARELGTDGAVVAFTIVHRAAPGIPDSGRAHPAETGATAPVSASVSRIRGARARVVGRDEEAVPVSTGTASFAIRPMARAAAPSPVSGGPS